MTPGLDDVGGVGVGVGVLPGVALAPGGVGVADGVAGVVAGAGGGTKGALSESLQFSLEP